MEFNWDSKYLINVKILDEQHQELFRLLNELYELPNYGGCDQKMDEILKNLLDYTVQHLDLEESLMQKYSYPEQERHTGEHQKFRHEVGRQAALFSDKKLNIFDLIVFIQDWLTSHILYSDHKLGVFLNASGID